MSKMATFYLDFMISTDIFETIIELIVSQSVTRSTLYKRGYMHLDIVENLIAEGCGRGREGL